MSQINLDISGIKTVLKQVAADMKSHAEELRLLDAKAGDGDLGVTIELAARGISDYLDSTTETDIGKLLVQCGMAVNKVSPSTFGTILASAFMGGGKAVTGKEQLDIEDLVMVGEGALENIRKRGKAEAGDKTLLDALIPSVETLKKQSTEGIDDREALRAAVNAAEQGMKATVNMKAKFGRVQWFREGSIGIQDAGATAIYFIIKSFADNMPV